MSLRFALGVCALVLLASSAAPGAAQMPVTYRFGPQRPDLLRYNRVEGLSLGGRVQIRPHAWGTPVSITGTLFGAWASQEVSAHLEIARTSLHHRISLHAYHEIVAVEEVARHLGIANSLLALGVGRDDGDYYRRAGFAAAWRPPDGRRQWLRVRAHAEHQEAVDVETDFAVLRLGDDDWAFRENLVADEGWEYGAAVALSPRWGLDQDESRGGVDATVAGAAGLGEHVRASVGGELHVALPGLLQVNLEAAGGTSWGSPSVQRLWYVGGPFTLRGYGPRTLVGTAFGRGRSELVRRFSFGSLGPFWDVGWAGDRGSFDLGDALHSVGGTLSLVDGLVRVDAGWALDGPRDFRLDIYLDPRHL